METSEKIKKDKKDYITIFALAIIFLLLGLINVINYQNTASIFLIGGILLLIIAKALKKQHETLLIKNKKN